MRATQVSRVTTVAYMFQVASAFNQDLGWCVSGSTSFLNSGCAVPNCGVSTKDPTVTTENCALRYCNAHQDLKNAFCNGQVCFTQQHSQMCINHWYQYGYHEAHRNQNPVACALSCNWDLPTPANTAEETECLGATGSWEGLTEDFCAGAVQDEDEDTLTVLRAGTVCCSRCVAVEGLARFRETFTKGPVPRVSGNHWSVGGADSQCVCLILEDVSDYGYNDKGFIQMTPQSDCVRVTGNHNSVLARRPRSSREVPRPPVAPRRAIPSTWRGAGTPSSC